LKCLEHGLVLTDLLRQILNIFIAIERDLVSSATSVIANLMPIYSNV